MGTHSYKASTSPSKALCSSRRMAFAVRAPFLGSRLGAGSYGTVSKAVHKTLGSTGLRREIWEGSNGRDFNMCPRMLLVSKSKLVEYQGDSFFGVQVLGASGI